MLLLEDHVLSLLQEVEQGRPSKLVELRMVHDCQLLICLNHPSQLMLTKLVKSDVHVVQQRDRVDHLALPRQI